MAVTKKNSASKTSTAKKSPAKTTARKSTSKSAAKTKPRSQSSSRAASATTTDHEVIRRWAEEREGTPACVRGTGGRGDTGVLRIDFPGGEEEKLQEISWDEWFEKFDQNQLAFLYQETAAGGEQSRFNKLVAREKGASRSKPPSRKKTLKAGG